MYLPRGSFRSRSPFTLIMLVPGLVGGGEMMVNDVAMQTSLLESEQSSGDSFSGAGANWYFFFFFFGLATRHVGS